MHSPFSEHIGEGRIGIVKQKQAVMSQETDENNPRVVAYPPVKFIIKKELDDPEELEASYLCL